MTTAWAEVQLGHVITDAQTGFASGHDLDEGVFQFRMNNVTRDSRLDLSRRRRVPWDARNLDRFLLRDGDVLFNATNSPDLVGKSAYIENLDEPAVFSNHFVRLRSERERLDPRYLARWLQREWQRGLFRSRAKQWVNQATYGRDLLLELKMPLPPPEEQRRIVRALDQADLARGNRRESLTLLRSLNESVFLEMFGDPARNPYAWPRATLGDLLARIDSGKSPVCQSRSAYDGEWGVLKLGAVTWCEYDDTENKALPPDVQADPRHEVAQGDLLLARKNTYELVGACAYVHETRPRLLLSDLIFRLVPLEDAPVLPVFLHALLANPRKRRELQSLAGGSAGSMPNISKQRLLGFEVAVPPVELQREFADRVARIRASLIDHQRSAQVLDDLFASLQHRAFSGTL